MSRSVSVEQAVRSKVFINCLDALQALTVLHG